MNQAALRAPQEFSKALLSLAPLAANGAENGAGIDRTGYTSAIADYAYAVAGGATGGTLVLQLQTAPDNATWSNVGTPVSVTLGASGIASLAADLSGCLQYVRVVSNASPTGGTNPVATVGGALRLYGPDRLPAL